MWLKLTTFCITVLEARGSNSRFLLCHVPSEIWRNLSLSLNFYESCHSLVWTCIPQVSVFIVTQCFLSIIILSVHIYHCVQIFSFYKDTSYIGLCPSPQALVTSFNLITSVKRPNFQIWARSEVLNFRTSTYLLGGDIIQKWKPNEAGAVAH